MYSYCWILLLLLVAELMKLCSSSKQDYINDSLLYVAVGG